MREGNIFSLFVSSHQGRVTPSQSHNTSTGPMSFLGVLHLYPIILPVVPCPFWGVPWDGISPVLGWSISQPGMDRGTPWIGQQREYLLCGGLRAVCLLRSRRRTFLFKIVFCFSQTLPSRISLCPFG